MSSKDCLVISKHRLIYVDGNADALRGCLYGGGGPQIGEVTCTCEGSPTYQVNVITGYPT